MGRIKYHPAHALQAWPDIENKLKGAAECYLFLDFDGTLSPIVDDPHRAALAPRARDLLRSLHRMAGIQIAIISGRNLNDVRSRVGLDLIYAGNHGLEIDGPGIEFTEQRASALAGKIDGICDDLSRRLSAVPGLLIERKGLTASVHLRRIPLEREAEVATAVRRAVEPFSSVVQVRAGNKALELLPRVEWNKGRAARKILQTTGAAAAVLPVCVGDDLTDEDLFREFPEGVTVRVGENGDTAAGFFVADPYETLALLERIVGAL
jgi:trehalose 6-phosphate phosphatase